MTIFSRSKENLTEIVPEVFGDYAVFLAFLDLSYNKLESLPESIFEAMPNLVCKLHSLILYIHNTQSDIGPYFCNFGFKSITNKIADFIGLPYFSGFPSGLKSHVLISHDFLSQSKFVPLP